MTELCEKEVLINEEKNTENKPMLLIGYYNYTVVLTYIGMFVGFVGIMFAVEKKIPQALLCLMISGFCDMFDGAIASTRKRTKQEKRFGIQIDSLSDLISFGVLPALIVSSQLENKFKLWICGTYVLSALIRLAYFNVDEEERQNSSEEKRACYKGLPVTTIAIMLPFLYQEAPKDYLYLLLLLGVSVAFLLPIEIKKPNVGMKIVMVSLGAFAFLKVLLELI